MFLEESGLVLLGLSLVSGAGVADGLPGTGARAAPREEAASAEQWYREMLLNLQFLAVLWD